MRVPGVVRIGFGVAGSAIVRLRCGVGCGENMIFGRVVEGEESQGEFGEARGDVGCPSKGSEIVVRLSCFV